MFGKLNDVKKITKEEFYSKYKKVKLKFDEYYKSTVSYIGETPDGNKLGIVFKQVDNEEYEYGAVYDKNNNIIEYFDAGLKDG